MEKLLKTNEESKRRVVIMIICNSTLNFALKIPYAIPSLNEFRILIHSLNLVDQAPMAAKITLNIFSSPFDFKFFCLSEKSCVLFQSFGNWLYLASLSTSLFFLKKFDMNFKLTFASVFKKTLFFEMYYCIIHSSVNILLFHEIKKLTNVVDLRDFIL